MIETKDTVIAYRCPYCGKGVISNEGVFALTAEKVSLRCPCKRSEAVFTYENKDKLKITAPCIFCPSPHTYSVSRPAFEGKEIFTLECPYTGSETVFIGDLDHVRAELSRTELEILNMMDENGIESFEGLHKKNSSVDADALNTIMYVLGELDEEGKIYCKCDSPSKSYEISETENGIIIKCTVCGASRAIPADSYLASQAFLDTDSITLE
ncbi:MAG: hypothetical protein IIX97_07285 [Clostridia bacterium]|nr:hypothetical protein [Clostridia bacterium]MBQ1259897.1 hypothetical protein [Clostridia bacterium]